MNQKKWIPANLQRFAEPNLNTNVTTDEGLTVEMKTYYSDYLIDSATPMLVHDQFGQKHPIPQNGGNAIEFRSFEDLPKALTPITEGVTPDGRKLTAKNITAEVDQYGDYIALSDRLQLTALDKVVVQATKKIGKQAGMTLDTITREVLNSGTNVQYADGSVDSRAALTADHKLTVDVIRRAVRCMKNNNVDPYDECYVAIIHPDVAYDLMSDPEWKYPHQYVDTEDIYTGEIGKIAGVRFVETTEAKKFTGAGSGGRDVYSTLMIGADAYGVVEVSGGGLQHIVKQLGSAGSADPLDQRSTVGWKAIHTAIILSQVALLRIETASTFNDGVAN